MDNENNNSNPQARTLYRHPLAAIGGAMVVAGGFLFVILLLLDLTAREENPYRSMITFIGAPAILFIGIALFALSAYLQVRAAHKRGENVRFDLRIDTSDPLYLRNLWLFLGMSAVLVVIAGYSGTQAFEYTESVAFCGEVCHTVMEPQHVTYHNSAHARVSCAECHIGPGATFWVKSKIDGVRQIFAVAFDSYDRPIPTPVHSLRPARETCEGCHWPDQFYGSKLVARTYYRTDEENSPWTINLLMKIGGGNPRVPAAGGVHWHMLAENKLEYVAADERRQVIGMVRATNNSGEVRTYRNTDLEGDPSAAGEGELRVFDCVDCHNRPSHTFLPPAVALNEALRARKVSPDLPYVRKVGLDLLNEEYPDREQARAAIEGGLEDYYRAEYPEIADARRAEITEATAALQEIYSSNFFPEMKTDYRARESNLSHFVNSGCFRCHTPSMVDEQGHSPSQACNTCHDIVAQGPSENVAELSTNLGGLEFQHPEDIDEAWKEMPCTDCHTPDDGY